MSVRPVPYSFPNFGAETMRIEDKAVAAAFSRLYNDLQKYVQQMANICNLNFRMLDRLGGPFFAQETATRSMQVLINAGFILNSSTPSITAIAAQTLTFTSPVSNPRIDRVTITSAGVAQITQGVEAANPTPPAIPAGNLPIAQVFLTPAAGDIHQSNITDERGKVAIGG